MRLSTTCPACGGRITLARVMLAPTPLHLSCGQCGMRLRVRGAVTPIVVALAVALGVALVQLIHMIGVAAALVPALGAIVVVDAVASMLVIGVARLEPRPR
jgi:ribosomal protein S27AE